MNTSSLIKRKMLLAAAGILVLAVGAWGAVALSRNGKPKSTLPKELSMDALKAEADNPGKLMQQVHQAMSRPDLTEEQRHELRHNAWSVMEAYRNQQLDDYFAAKPSDRQAILDQHLNEWQQHRTEREREGRRGDRGDRGDRQRGGGPVASSSGTNSTNSTNAGAAPGGGRGRDFHRDHSGTPTREQRKDHFESRDPDQRARRMNYFNALAKRAEQRGLQTPWGAGMGRRP